MVYKKYIKRNGRVYGPYSYRSRKENGKVITEYLGHAEPEKKFIFPIKNVLKPIALLVFLILVFLAFFLINSNLTGKVALQIQSNYQPGEQINGNLKMSLKQGELIPADTKIIIDNSGEILEYLLSDLISGELISGNFYADGKTISGSGEGFGVLGEKKIYPTLNFELKIKKATEEIQPEQIPETEQPEQEQTENQTQETPVEITQIPITETQTEEQEKTENKESESVSESISEETALESQEESATPNPAHNQGLQEGSQSNSPITGEAVSDNENKVTGQVSKDAPFVYNLQEGETAEIKQNSVELNGTLKGTSEKIGDDKINLEIENNQVVVMTDYYYIEKGFGAEYLTNEEKTINIDLTQLGLIAQDGKLIVKLVYGDTELANSNEQINVEEPIEIVNETIEKNVTEIIGQNITREINTTLIENITTLQYRAVIGRPVKWIKTVKTNVNNNLSIELPKKSVNISIKTGEEVQQALMEFQDYENIVSNTDRNNFITGQVTGVVSLDIEKNQGFLTRFFNWLSNFGLTGNVISEKEALEDITETINSRIVDVDDILTKANVSGEVDVGVEYYTDAPVAVEENISNGKRIIISSTNGLNYTEILAYTLIEKNISMKDVSKIKIYHHITQEEYNLMNKQIEEGIAEANTSVDNNIINPDLQNKGVMGVVNDSESIINQTESGVINETIEQNETKEENITSEQTINQTEGNEINNNATTPSEPASESNINQLITGQITSELTQSEINNSNKSTGENKLIKVEIPFNAYDLDKDGYVDYVEWIVPHLSEQVYEIIYIEKAVHLDENKNFISDIYEQVKEKDNIWSGVINNSHYVRVTFEKELDNTKDITIYARSSRDDTSGGVNSGEPSFNNQTSSIEVYAGCDSYVMINGIEVPYDIYLKKKRIEEIRGILNE